MKITSRFTVAVHTLMVIQVFSPEYKITSDFIASSVNVNSVVIRRVLGSLKEAGIVEVKAGSGGASLSKNLKDITLYDVYKAVNSVEDNLFNFHDNPNPVCPVGKNIHSLLDSHLMDAQKAMENELKKVTLDQLLDEYKKKTM